MSKLIENIEAIKNRAAQLNCTVEAVLNNVVLCRRGDNTFITWRVGLYAGQARPVAEFISGVYDTNEKQGQACLIERALS